MKTIIISDEAYIKLKETGKTPNQRIEELLGLINVNVRGRPQRTTWTEQELKEYINRLFINYTTNKQFQTVLKSSVLDVLNNKE